MEISELKNTVLSHIESADKQLLELMKSLAESYENQNNSIASISEKQYEILDERRVKHLAGESKSLSWEEVKKSARNSKK